MADEMMRCDDIEATLEAGEVPRGAAAEAHLEVCATCRELVFGERLKPLLEASDPRDGAADVDALFAAVREEVDRERGPLSYLRSRPTWVRRALLIGVAIGLPTVLLVSKGVVITTAWATMAVGGVLLLGALLLGGALRPIHRPARPPWRDRILLGAALALPVLVALLANPGPDPAPSGGLACFLMGVVAGLPIAGFAWLLSRGRTATASLFGATGASLVAFVALHAICGSTHPEHLLVGHASVVWAALGLVSVAFAARMRQT